MFQIDTDEVLEKQEVAPRHELLSKFESHTAHVAVLGMGYVGIPLAEAILSKGFTVSGVDVDAEKMEQLMAGKSFLNHISDERITAMLATERFFLASDPAPLAFADVILICVPTPLGRHHEPIMDYVVSAGEMIESQLHKGQLIVLESSTYPGTTNEVLKPILERNGMKAGEDFFLAFSPEREDPGNADFTTGTIPKIVGGDGKQAGELVRTFYNQFIDTVVPVSSPEAAEAAKLLENIFRLVNIGLVNELKMIFDGLKIDIWEVINAAKTKPFGFMPFYPGPGVGGHCIPLDPYYLTWKAQEYDFSTRFIDLAGQINEHMPNWVRDKIREALDENFGKGIRDSKILLVGLAYKKNSDDMRESPALKLAKLLVGNKANIFFHDPHIGEIPEKMKDESALFNDPKSVPLAEDSLKEYDAVVILTAHDDIDYERLVASSRLVVDTQNVTEPIAQKYSTPIIKA